MNDCVHWHEGLFLQPHHLQAHGRWTGDRLSGLLKTALPFPYGVLECRVNTDALQGGLARLDALHAVMPDGTELIHGENCLVQPLSIKETFAAARDGMTIGLALPRFAPTRPNSLPAEAVQPGGVPPRYLVESRQVTDENTGDNAKTLDVRRYNAMLVLADEAAPQLDVLPLCRVVRGTGEDVGHPILDTDFAPPCLHLTGSGTLLSLLRDLSTQLEVSRGQIVDELKRQGFQVDAAQGPMTKLLKLRSLGAHAPVISAMIAAEHVAPFEAYTSLRSLLGELAALQPADDLYDVGDYTHDQPLTVFTRIDRVLRRLIAAGETPSGVRLPLEIEATGPRQAYVTNLTLEHLENATGYYLAIESQADEKTVSDFVVDANRFKFMPYSLRFRTVFGVALLEERHPPVGLPQRSGLHYFRLDRNANAARWETVVQDGRIAVHWAGLGEATDPLTGANLTLYLTGADG